MSARGGFNSEPPTGHVAESSDSSSCVQFGISTIPLDTGCQAKSAQVENMFSNPCPLNCRELQLWDARTNAQNAFATKFHSNQPEWLVSTGHQSEIRPTEYVWWKRHELGR